MKTPKRTVLFPHSLQHLVQRLFVVFGVALTIASVATGVRNQTAQAATNNTLNFQARLLNKDGSLVKDGYYNIEFKLYNTTVSSGSSQGGCTGDASCLWTETRTGGNRVRVFNGYVTVNLGSVTPLPNINWSQDLYLSMNVGGNAVSPSWDGPMTPRLHLTAVPYALTSASLSVQQGSYGATLTFATLTNNRTITLPDASGTICLDQSVNNCGYLTAGGASGSYVAKGTALETGNFALQSAAATSVGGVIQGAAGQTANLMNFNSPTGTVLTSVAADGSVTITNNLAVGGAATFNTLAATSMTQSGNMVCDNSGNCSAYAGGSGSGNYIQNQYAIAQTANFNIQTAAVGTASAQITRVASQTAPLLKMVDENNATLFTVNADGSLNATKAINVNGSIAGAALGVTNVQAANTAAVIRGALSQTGDLLQLQNDSGRVLSSFNASGDLILGKIATDSTARQGRLILGDGTTNGFAATILVNTLEDNYNYVLPDGGGSICTSTTGCGASAGSGNYIQVTNTLQANANFYVQAGSTNTVTGRIRALAGQTSDLLQFMNSAGVKTSGFSADGQLTLGTISMSGSSLQSGSIRFADGAANGLSALLQSNLLTGNRTINLPDESGTLCVQNSSACGFQVAGAYAPGTAASYIQNGTTLQTTANFNISGSGSASILNATSALQLNGTNINTAGTLSNVAYLNQANAFSGNLSVTGTNTFTTGTGTVTLGSLGLGIVQADASGVLTSSSVDRNSATLLSGTLNVANGGTGLAAITANGLIYGNGTNAVGVTAAGTSGQIVVANASGVPTFVSLSGDVTVSATGVTTIGDGVVTNTKLANSSVTITPGTNLTDGGTVALGGTITLNVANSPSFSGTVNAVTGYNLNGTSVITAAGVLQNVTANANIITSGILPIARGGTGVGTVPTNGQLLIGNGTGYTQATLTAGTGVAITNAAGAVTVAIDNTVCTTSNNCGYASGSFINNGTAVQTGANFNIGGNGVIGGTLNVSGASTLASLAVTGNQTIGGTLGVTGASTFTGLVTANGGVTINGATATADILNGKVTADANARFRVQANGTLNFGGGTAATDTDLYRSAAGVLATSGSLTVQNTIGINGTATGTRLFINTNSATTTGATIRAAASQTADLFQIQNAAGTANLAGFNAAGRLFYQSGSFTGTLLQGSLTANRTYTLPDASGTICLDNSVNNCNYAAASGSANYIQNGVATQTANFNIQSGSATSVAAVIQSASGGTADILQVFNASGTKTVYVDAAGRLYSEQSISTGTTSTTAKLNVQTSGTGVIVNVSGTSAIANFQNNGTNVVTIGSTGATTIKNSTNSTSVLATQNANGDNLFRVDTQNNQVALLENNSPETSAWTSTATTNLSAGGAVAYNGYLYMVGGTGSTLVRYAKINADGSTAAWQANTAMPVARDLAGVGVSNGFLYVIGGRDGGGTATNTSYYSKINADGTLGAWNTTSTLPANMNNFGFASYNGYLYTTGNSGSSNVSYYAKVNADGTLGAWTATTNLPGNRSAHAMVAANGYMLLVGGTTVSSYYSKINADGTLGTWTATTNLPALRNNAPAVLANGYLYVLGGNDGATNLASVAYAKVNADGSLGAWTTSANAMPAGKRYGGAAVYGGIIYYPSGATNYQAALARVKVSGTLDLVGNAGGDAISNNGAGELLAGNTGIMGSLMVQGDSALRNTAISGVLNVSGATVLGSTLTVNGATVIQSTLSASGALQTGTTTTAGSVVVTAGNNFAATIQSAVLTANRTFTLPDVSGTLCTTTTCAAGNSANYIQNGTTQQTAANFNIDGNGVLGGTLNVSGVSTLSGLSVTGSASVGGNLAVTGTTTFTGAVTANGSVILNGATAATNVLSAKVTGDANTRFTIGSDGKLSFGTGSAATDTTLYRASSGLLTTDTGLSAAGRVAIGSSTLFSSAALSIATNNSTVPGAIIRGAASQTADLIQVQDNGTNILAGINAAGAYYLQSGNFKGTFGVASLTANRTYTLPDASGTICLQNSNTCGFLTGSAADFIQNTTSQQTNSNFNVSGTGTASILNATSALQLNGTSINTAGTLSNVAYLNQANAFSGNLSVTGTNTFTTGTGAVTLGSLGVGLVQSSSAGVLSSGAVDRNSATLLSGTLSVANGGTGFATATANGIVFGNGTGNLNVTSAGTSGQLLVANASGVPTFVSLSGDITVSATGVTTIANGVITTAKIADAAVTNAKLVNSSVTITAGTNITGGGNVALGGTLTVSVADAPTFSGAVTAGGALRSGTSTAAGSIVLQDGAGNSGTLQLTAALAGNVVFQLPGGLASGNYQICTSNNNCNFATGGGSYINNSTTLQTSANLNIDGTAKAAIINATSALQLNGTSINTAGTLSNVAYLNQANSFTGNLSVSGTNTFSVGTGAVTLGSLGTGIVQSNSAGLLSSGVIDRNSSTLLSGTLNVANGGTGFATAATNGIVYGNGTSALGVTAAGTSGQLLVANASGVPTFVSVSGDVTVSATGVTTIANGAITTAKLADAAVTNVKLANSAVTVTAGTNLIDGGTVALGGTVTLNVANSPSFTGTVNAATGYNLNGTSIITAAGVLQNVTANANIITSGILPIARGGTGVGTVPTNGQLLIGNGTGYTQAALTAGSGIAITNGAGAITVAIDNTVCTTANNCGYATGSFIVNGTATTTGNFNIQSSAVGNVTANIRALAGQTADLFRLQNNDATATFARFDATGNLFAPSITTTGNATIGGTLGVTGATTLSTLSATTGAFSGTVTSPVFNAGTGFQIGGAAAAGQFLRGNGTNFVSSAIQASDIVAGSNNYIQNQNSADQTANFRISGNGQIGGTLNVSGASTLASLSVTGNATVGGTLAVTGASTFTGSLTANGGVTLNGAATTTNVLNAQVTGDTNPRITIGADGKLSFGAGAAATDTTLTRSAANTLSTSGALSVGAGLNVNNDFRVGSSGRSFMGIGTDLGGFLNITVPAASATTRPAIAIRAPAGQTADAFQFQSSASGNATLFGINAGGSLYYGNSGFTNTVNTATLTANRTISLPDASGTICLQNSTACGFQAAGTYAPGTAASYIANGSTQQTSANFNIDGTGTAVILNASSALQLNGTSINTAGTLTNVAYLNQANAFAGNLSVTGSNSFSTGTGVVTIGSLGAGVVQSSATGVLSSGTLTVANGGTGRTSVTANGVVYGNGTSALGVTAAGTSGQLLVANASGVPTFVSLSGDVTVSATGVTTIADGAITTSKLADASVTNAKLANNSVTITAGTNLTTGGTVALGGSVTLNVANSPSFSGTVNAVTGFQFNGTAASGNFLRGNGTNFVSSAIQASDIPDLGGSYIKNGTAIQTGNFNIQSASTSSVTATIQGAIGQTANLLEIKQGGGGTMLSLTNGGTLTVNSNVNSLNGGILTNNVVRISNAGDLTVGNGSLSGTLAVTGASTFTGAVAANGGATFNAPNTSSTGLTIVGANGQTSNVFNVTNNGGTSLLAVNGSGQTIAAGSLGVGAALGSKFSVVSGSAAAVGQIIRGTTSQTGDLFQLQDVSGNILSKFSANGQLTLGTIATSGTVQGGSLTFSDGTTSGFGATISAQTLTANRAFTLPNVGGEICTTANNCNYATGGGSYINNGTALQTNANINIQSASTTNPTAIFRAAAGQTGNVFEVQNSGVTAMFYVTSGGSIVVSNNANIGGQLQINGNTVIDGSRNLTVVNATASGTLSVTGNSTLGGTLAVTGASTFTGAVTASGGVTSTTVNATTGFRINNAATAGQFLRGDGTNFVSSAIQASDIPDLSTSYIKNQTTQQASSNFNISGAGVIGTTLNVSGATTLAGLNATNGAFSGTLAVTGASTFTGSLTANGGVTLNGAAATTTVLNAQVTGDANSRFTIGADGKLSFGTGTAAADTTFYRDASNSLRSSGKIQVGTQLNAALAGNAGSSFGAAAGLSGVQLTVYAGSNAANIAQVLRGAVSQTGDLFQLQSGDTGNAVLAKFDATGNLTVPTITTTSVATIGGLLTANGGVSTTNVTASGSAQAVTVNATTGFRVNGAAAAGQFLRGDGTNFVSSAIQASDLPDLGGTYIRNQTTQQATSNFNISGAGVIGTTLNVSGATTLAGLSATNGAFSGTLGVTGTSSFTGNVGIGAAASGTYALNVQKAGAQLALFQSTGANVAFVDINNAAGGNQTGINLQDGGTTRFQIGKQTDNSFYIYDNANTRDAYRVVSGNTLLQPTGGNVSIGTTNSNYRLDVNGTFNASGASTLGSTLAVTGSSIFTGAITANGGVTGTNLNATTALQLNGANINTAGTLSNVAYLNQANAFAGNLSVTGANTFTTGTGTVTLGSLGAGVVQSSASGVLSSGTLSVANGGTGLTTAPANGRLLIGNGTGYTLANLTAGTGIAITNGSGSITVATDNTVCTTANNCNYAVGNFIQNSATQQAGANFNIGANGVIGGTLNVSGATTLTSLSAATAAFSGTAGTVGLSVSAAASSSADIARFLAAGTSQPTSGVDSAGQLFLQNGSSRMTFATSGLNAAQTITFPNATGTVCLQNSTACGFVTGAATNFIANSTSVQAGANFNISANGVIGGTLNVTGASTLGTVSATTGSFSSTLGVTGNATFGGGTNTFSNGTGTSKVLTVKNTADGSQRLTVSANGVFEFANGTDASDVNFYRSAASTLYTNGSFGIGTTDASALNARLGLTSASASTIGQVIRGSASQTADLLQLQTGATGNAALSGFNNAGQLFYQSGNFRGAIAMNGLSANQTYTLPAIGGTFCLDSNNCNYAPATGSTAYIQNGTSVQTANFNISANGVIGGTLNVTGATSIGTLSATTGSFSSTLGVTGNATFGGTANTFSNVTGTSKLIVVKNASDGTNRLTISANGVLEFANGTDASDVNLYRSQANTLFTGNNFGVGTADGSSLNARLGVGANGGAGIGFAVRAGASQTGDLFQLQNNAGNAVLSGFKANGSLYFGSGNFTNTVATAALSANQTITLPNASGTVCLDSNNCNNAPATGSANYIQNTTTTQASSNFNISANGVIGGTLNVTGTTTTGVLNSGNHTVTGALVVTAASTFQNDITINTTGSTTTAPRTLSMAGGTYGNGNANRFLVDSGAGIQTAFNNRTQLFAYHGVVIQGGRGTNTAPGFTTGNGAGDASLYVQGSGATAAVQIIQGASGQTGDLLQNQNNTGATIYSGFTSAGNLFYINNGFRATLNTATLGAARTYTLPDESGTLCIQGSANCGFVTGSAQNFIANQTNQQANSNFNISGNGTIGAALNVTGTSTLQGATTIGAAGANTLTINSGTAGVTGLRFSQVNSNSTGGSTYTGVIGVDENGNVGLSALASQAFTSQALAYWDGTGDPSITGRSYPQATVGGSAAFVSGQGVRLTNNTSNQNGSLSWNFSQQNFERVQFQMKAGGGNGADATWFYGFGDGNPTTEYGTGFTKGYMVYFSEYHDCIGLTWGPIADGTQCSNGGGTNVAGTKPLKSVKTTTAGQGFNTFDIDDNQYHDIDISILQNKITISWDGVIVLSYDDIYTRDIAGTRFGFGARTGGSNNQHYISGLIVTKMGTNAADYRINNVTAVQRNVFYRDDLGQLGINTATPGATLGIQANSAATVATRIRGFASQTSDLLQLQNSAGTTLSRFNANGQLFAASVDSADFINAATTISAGGNITVGGFDFKLGTSDQTSRGNSGLSRALVKDTGNVLVFNYENDYTGGTKIDSALSVTGNLTTTGTLTVDPSANSTTAIRVINVANVSQFSVDTTNSRVLVGPSGGNATATLLVVGMKTGAGDPTGTNGAIYYNNSTQGGKFRCYEGGSWGNCIGMPDVSERRWGYVAIAGTNSNAFQTAGTLSATQLGLGGTATSSPQSTSNFIDYATNATTNATAGVAGSALSATATQARYLPRIMTRIYTGSTVANYRYWFGLASSSLAGTEPVTNVTGNSTTYVGIGSPSNSSALICGSGDGANHSGVSTGVTLSANTTYDIIVDYSNANTLICSISANGGAWTTVSKTNTLPTGGTNAVNLGLTNVVTTTTGASRSLKISYVYMGSN